jgi:hypothetical protein
MSNGNFETLVSKGIILKPLSFSEDDKNRINSLTPEEVGALISIRAKLGDDFLRTNTAGLAPSIAIVF